MLLTFQFYGLSDIGPVRPNNEDAWVAKPDIGLFALADGMGGHSAGEVAAKETIERFCQMFTQHLLSQPKQISPDHLLHTMHASIEFANQWVYRMSKQKKEYDGMGTTLCCLYWTHETIVYAHVGDSRIYLYRDKKLRLLTKDHSLFTKWMDLGKKAEECKTPYPYKHVITRAIGTHPKSDPEVVISDFEPNDLFLLCTDGLSDFVSLQEMQEILNQTPCLEQAAERLIQQSKLKGSSDNMTVLMIQNLAR
ncbi:MAG: protein phosphatase 2C domain-containing protein [Chlamydiales bacterium]|nr:protein phosphatase 2C domain-containing protein [Chlamydiales bacterium]